MAVETYGPWCKELAVNWEAWTSVGTWAGAIAVAITAAVAIYGPRHERAREQGMRSARIKRLIQDILFYPVTELTPLESSVVGALGIGKQWDAMVRASIACRVAIDQFGRLYAFEIDEPTMTLLVGCEQRARAFAIEFATIEAESRMSNFGRGLQLPDSAVLKAADAAYQKMDETRTKLR